MAEFFRRVEKKYILTRDQYLFFKDAIKEKMREDEHGKSTICNIYFDSDEYDLIRHSITKPIYKDKIRLRSYNIPTMDSTVFLEVKRKYNKIVSKRRIEMKLSNFYKYLNNEENALENSQIKKELDYYFKFYKLKPTMFLSYYRRAFYDKENDDFRLTFDSHVLARNYDLELEKGNYGVHILEKNYYIMEIKTLSAIPMWFVKLLNECKLAPCGFSKYGEAYTQLILNTNDEENVNKKLVKSII